MATTRLGRYDLVAPLGRGGMAEVWRAKARGASRFSRDVAVKVMLPEFAADADIVTMFIDEACVAAKLEHPNIVQTHDFGRAGDRYFIVLELIDGISLRSLPRDEKLTLAESVLVIAEMAAALDYAYGALGEDGTPLRLVHRDVNPSNIMLTARGAVKLADFGIAKTRMSTAVTTAGSLKGKLHYMSPEQAAGGVLDARSDVYALGLTLYELLAGERALRGRDEIEVLEAARRGGVPRLVTPVPAALADLVARALSVEPAARFATGGELRQALLPFLDGASISSLHEQLAARVREVLAHEQVELAPALGPASTDLDVEGTEPATRPDRGREESASRGGTASSSRRTRVAAVAVFVVSMTAVGAWRILTTPHPIAKVALPAALPVEPPQAPAPVAPTPIAPTPVRPIATEDPARVHAPHADAHGPATLRIRVEPWAQIAIDGRDVGMTPLRPLELTAGKHEIVAVNPALGKRHRSVQVTAGESKLVEISFDDKKH